MNFIFMILEESIGIGEWSGGEDLKKERGGVQLFQCGSKRESSPK